MDDFHTTDELRCIARVLECLNRVNDDERNELTIVGRIEVLNDGSNMGAIQSVDDTWYYFAKTKGDNDE